MISWGEAGPRRRWRFVGYVFTRALVGEPAGGVAELGAVLSTLIGEAWLGVVELLESVARTV